MITFKDCVFRQVDSVPLRWKEGLMTLPDGTVFKNENFIYENNGEDAIWYDPCYQKTKSIWKEIIEKFLSVIAIR